MHFLSHNSAQRHLFFSDIHSASFFYFAHDRTPVHSFAYIYFSLVALATVRFGDISPVSSGMACSLVSLEVISCFIFITGLLGTLINASREKAVSAGQVCCQRLGRLKNFRFSPGPKPPNFVENIYSLEAVLETLILGTAIFVIFILITGMRVVRPTHRGLIERLGRYNRFAEPGFHLIIPLLEQLYLENVTEQMVDATPQEIITFDNLNARVDAQVYFKVKQDEGSVKNSLYNVNNVQYQIVNLARTTLRNIIGTMTLKSANSERGKINEELHKILMEETKSWGIEIVRTELKEIDPPKDVQETMNKVVKAENEKIAAVDYATAAETAADGEKRAQIKKAEGVKQARILQAEGEAEAIRLVNEAANKYFTGNAQVLRKLQAVENAFEENTKIVVPANAELVNMIGDMGGIIPLKKDRAGEKENG